MNNIRINMRGQPCPNCGMVIYQGDWHHCPIENAKSIAKKDDEIAFLHRQLNVTVEALEDISSRFWDDEPKGSPQGFLRSIANIALRRIGKK